MPILNENHTTAFSGPNAERIADLRAQATARLDAAEKALQDVLGDDETKIAEAEELRQEARELGAEADALSAQDAEEMAPQARLTKPEPTESERRRAQMASSTLTSPTAATGVQGTDPRAYQSMFPRSAAAPSNWKSHGEFLSVLSGGRHDERLARPMGFGGEYEGGAGGFLVPAQIMSEVLNGSLGDEVIRPRARVMPMISETLSVVISDRADRSGGKVGGFIGQFLGEGEEASYQTPSFGRTMLRAKKCAIFAQLSLELQQDAEAAAINLFAMLREGLSFTLDGAFINGNGTTGQPIGLLNAANLIGVPKVVDQQAGTITYRNLVDMAARLTPGSWPRAVWLVNQTTLPELWRLTFSARDDGGQLLSGEAVASPVFSVDADGTMRILGRPCIVTEHLPELGKKGDIMLADLSEYLVGVRADATLETSNAPGWRKSLIDYRLIIRVDGKPRLPDAQKPKRGLSVSPFVTLAART